MRESVDIEMHPDLKKMKYYIHFVSIGREVITETVVDKQQRKQISGMSKKNR